jgi:hypothetical protein
MAVPWYEWRNIRNRLIVFGRAIQGVSPYRVLIEPDRKKCPTGYCNFTKKEVAVNPDLFDLTPSKQYQLTKSILVHEAGHRRFTTPGNLSSVVGQIANILEDERIERLMADEFAGLRTLVRDLSRQLYLEAMPVDQKSDSHGEIVSYFLQLRWAKRIGKTVKGLLSLHNQELWQKVEPLVYEAWQAESSEIVDRNAEEIVRILGLKEYQIPEWIKKVLDKLGTIQGNRGNEDKAEETHVIDSDADGTGNTSDDAKPFDGDIPPNDKCDGKSAEAIEPMPYIWLEEKVGPLVLELIEELRFDEANKGWEQVERGGKLSMREYLKDRSHPFLSEEGKSRNIPALAVKIIVDHSTSLNHTSGDKTRIESIAESVMMLHLVCLELSIPHEIIATPQQMKVADMESGEKGKALIAGLVPAKCGHEDMGLAIKTHALPLTAYPQDIKVVICLTDGACNDARLGKEMCQSLRGKVEVIGLLLDPDERTKAYVIEMFGQDRVIACKSQELPHKLGNILRAIRGI